MKNKILLIFVLIIFSFYLFYLLNSIFPVLARNGGNTPQWSQNSTNNTAAGQPTLFSVNWTDAVGLSGYIFSTNNSGSWENETWTPFYEDFTTYTEEDPNNHITVAENHIDFDAYCNEDAYVYKDMGSGHFSGDFEHLITVRLGTEAGTTPRGYGWALTNTVDDLRDIDVGGGDYLGLMLVYDSRIAIEEVVAGTAYNDVTTQLSVSSDTWYYLKIKRNESIGTYGRLYCYIYSDTERTNLVDTLQLDLHEKEDFRYIFASVTYNPNWDGHIDNDIENLTLRDTQSWSNVAKILNSTAGALVQWKVYANDTSNNWNTSETYSLTTTSAMPPLVPFNLSKTKVWWNDTIIARGRAYYIEGTPISSASVNLTLDNIRSCNNVTDSNGYWSCSFNAPNELGTYTVTVAITKGSDSFTNSTTLEVKPSYGIKPIGTIDRVVYEIPVLIQELSGRIRRIFTRIIVWRG